MPPKKKTHVKLILVKWRDATHVTDDSEGAQPGTMLAWTIGFEVYRTKKEVALCMELHENGDKRDTSTIPRGMVVHIKTLARIPITVE